MLKDNDKVSLLLYVFYPNYQLYYLIPVKLIEVCQVAIVWLCSIYSISNPAEFQKGDA